jgi:hypothetical protein
MGSYIIRRISFTLFPQDGGVSLKLSPFLGYDLPHTSLSSYEDTIHGLKGSVRLVHEFHPNMPHKVKQ